MIPFVQRKRVLLFPCSSSRKTDYINNSAHGSSLLMVSTQVFHALIFRSFGLHGVLQQIISIMQLPCKDSYYRYIGFNVFQIRDSYKLYYVKYLFKVHFGPCYIHFLSPIDASHGGSTQFLWCLSARPSWGWLVRLILLPQIPYVKTTFRISPWIFQFYKVHSPTTFIFSFGGFSAVSIT